MTGSDDRDQRRREAEAELGTAGASARARYDALRRRDSERRRETFGRLAPLARLLARPNASTEAWARGAEGEERVGALLRRAVGENGVVLHDRSIPHSRANLDHIAVVPSGVWVIDSKHYRGRLERRGVGGWFRSRAALYVAGRDHSTLVHCALRQRSVVAAAAGPDVPVRAALCFTGAEWPRFARPFTIDGVLVTWPKALARVLGMPGRLDASTRTSLATRMAVAFPPYVPR